MWISRKRFENLKIYIDKEDVDHYNRLQNQYFNLENKYLNLLNHLGLVEWIEAPKDAIPAKTVLITKKEQKKRNKNKQQSWIDPKVRQQQQQADMFRNVYNCGYQVIPPAWQNQTFSGILGSFTSSK